MSHNEGFLQARRHKDRGESFPLSAEELETNILKAVGIGDDEQNTAFRAMFARAVELLDATKDDIHILDGDIQKLSVKDNPSRLQAAKLLLTLLQATKGVPKGRSGPAQPMIQINMPEYYPRKDEDDYEIDIEVRDPKSAPDSQTASPDVS